MDRTVVQRLRYASENVRRGLAPANSFESRFDALSIFLGVLNVNELHALFVVKYSSEIEGIVWMKSAADFVKLRSSLAAYKNFWLFLRGLDLSKRHYSKTRKVLGEDCPEFTRDDALFDSLSGYFHSLDPDTIFKAMSDRLNSMARSGAYKI